MAENWNDVTKRVDQLIIADGREFAATATQALQLFTAFATNRYLAPDDVDTGYGSTICISWSIAPAPIELEITARGYEFYRFFDGLTDIREFKTSEAFPIELAELLDPLIGIATIGR